MDEEEFNDDGYLRYFIIYFTGLTTDNKLQRGKLYMFIEKGGFVNEEHIHECIVKEFKLTSPYVEQIRELDEEDFNDFTRTKKEGNFKEEKFNINTPPPLPPSLPPTDNDLDDFI